MEPSLSKWRRTSPGPWACSRYTLSITILGFASLLLMTHSFLNRQLDAKGCDMAYMWPTYARFDDFNSEHTRFAGKYSLYIYREGGMNEDSTVKGVPVLFIPGNAGSYKQVRSLASEAAYHYHNNILPHTGSHEAEKSPLDFFTVDFNEDFTAFHGQTLLDQAEYLNDAITYILSLYHTPGRFNRSPDLPDPTSVIMVGHSMGGVVARTMVTMPNYQSNSINTIVTLAAPHARPPVSFDGDMIRIYKEVNAYWRHAYSQESIQGNPLRHVTLISIAGGSLDTLVPSDYVSIECIVPETHGFTVFTSSMPNVWTGMDHLAITWCDQSRKSIVRALYDIIDVSRATQTTSQVRRMMYFKKWFLTGLEDTTGKVSLYEKTGAVLTLDNQTTVLSQGARLILTSMGQRNQESSVHLLPVPSPDTPGSKFTLLINESMNTLDDHSALEVLLCTLPSLQSGKQRISSVTDMHDLNDSSGAIDLLCKHASSDAIALPVSTQDATFPFKSDRRPFSYLQYSLSELLEYQFIAIVDKASEPRAGWVLAEFSNATNSLVNVNKSLSHIILSGLSLQFLPGHPLMVDIKIPALHSSLLAYNLHAEGQTCDGRETFALMVRQYITNVHESKYFVNVKEAGINLHGVSPYMPRALRRKEPSNGLSLQMWSDPSCGKTLKLTLKVDILGSMGKLWMRYRIVFTVFPLFIVALVLRQQFAMYDETGIFMSFSQGLNESLIESLPLAVTALMFLSIALSWTSYQSVRHPFVDTVSENPINDNSRHELLLGSGDVFFWFLVPLFTTMCFGVCVAVNYAILSFEYGIAFLASSLSKACRLQDKAKKKSSIASMVLPSKRIVTTALISSLISTFIPYHLAYVVLCLEHFTTCVQAIRLAEGTGLEREYNFYNYAHSMLILMLWILPINIPVLVVWVRNLTVPWLTPFSPHHNVLSIIPFVLLVEMISAGCMIPRIQSRWSQFTGILIFSIGAYAALYGVTYAYVLHYLANVLCAWLLTIQFDTSSVSKKDLIRVAQSSVFGHETKKLP